MGAKNVFEQQQIYLFSGYSECHWPLQTSRHGELPLSHYTSSRIAIATLGPPNPGSFNIDKIIQQFGDSIHACRLQLLVCFALRCGDLLSVCHVSCHCGRDSTFSPEMSPISIIYSSATIILLLELNTRVYAQ